MSGGLSQQFCVRWNSHLGSLGAAFPQLLAGQRFVDVTLACEGHQVHCHRLVLAACSSYFESLLGENPCKHPIIILPRDIKLWEIQALVDFMYKGEVNVSQAGLPDLLKCAEILQIRGLCGSDAALNLNQISANTTNSIPTTANLINDNVKNNCSKPNLTSTPNKNQINSSQVSNNISKKTNDHSTPIQNNAQVCNNQTPKLENLPNTTNPVMNQNATTSNNLSIDSQPMIQIPLPTSNASVMSMDDCDDSLNGSTSELLDDPDMKIQDDYSNDGSMVKLEPENKQPSPLLLGQQSSVYQQETSKFGKIRVKSRDNLFENYNSNKNYHPSSSSLSSSYNLVVNDNDDNLKMNLCDSLPNFVASSPPRSSSPSTSMMQRNIKIIENELLPPSLKFNKNSMTIFVKKTNELNDSGIGGDTELSVAQSDQISNLVDGSGNSNENLYENIVCSPNLLQLSFDDKNDDDDDFIDMNSEIMNTYCSTPQKINKKRRAIDENGTHHLVPSLLKYESSSNNKQLLKELKRQDEKMAIESSLLSGGPPPESFVLRNPRGNQPRTYNTDALWAALMNVKAGESIYRASRIHNVPRKTLRNWMKRWDIKSAYPMPRQLKQAAEKQLAMANVTCEYEGATYASGRRVRRSETLLRQAAECVSRGQTFQTVSDMFHIPISTIRFFMARKGILPRRKRGRASGTTNSDTSLHHNSGNTNNDHSRSSSPSEPPFHFAHYKLPELRPKLV